MTDRAAEFDEARLVAAAKGGDYNAFHALVEAHAPHLYALARRVTGQDADAEDVVQTTFLKALENLANFREEAAFGTWVHAIAVNSALKLLRQRKRTWVGQPGDGEDDSLPQPQLVADWRPSVEQQVEQREFHELLQQVLDELDEKHRVVFVLRDIEQMSVKETAATLGLTESNVKVRLMRARLMLRERLTALLGEGPNLKAHMDDHDHAHLLEGRP
ncbi:MAG: sigma-70 family RNA polymerase sigma factor [Phycisphaeraceae bacterium]|nr:sigma-70 family RNA polymerase sigma factor [Phycisphaeraceae bacterium]